MTNEIKAEFKKLFTTRSTYFLLGLIVALVGLFGFFVGGWHAQMTDLLDPHHIMRVSQQSVSFLSLLTGITAILLFAHEFRYNTIYYSLTLSNNRNKVLASKIIVISIFALVVTAFIGIASPLLSEWGIHANHLKMVPQIFYFKSMLWRELVYGWGYAMVGLVLAALLRNLIGAIIAIFILPDIVEGLFSIWLKNNTVYLPFSALHTMLGAGMDISNKQLITPLHAMEVFLGYLVTAWIIAWILFIKRDAN